jgi:hypothetical protein
VRRSPAGFLLIISGGLFALAIGCWWLQQVAFTPTPDTDDTAAIVGDEDIRSEIATVVASADAPVLEQSPTQLKEFVEQIAALDAGAALMTEFVADAHARLIGELDEPVRITGPEQAQIVRDERVAVNPPITLPVQQVSSLEVVDTLLGWTALVALAAGFVALVAGFVFRPERGEGTFAVSAFFLMIAVMLVVFGYLVPLAVLPALSDDTWMGVFPSLANEKRAITFGAAIAFAAAGGAIYYLTSSRRQRRQSSTPLSMGRYREQHRWSR